MTPGIHDISNEQYHSGPGISRSAIMELKRSPLHYHSRYVQNIQAKATAAMEFGTAFHTAVLEPNNFQSDYVAEEKFDKRTTQGKIDTANYEASKNGRKELSISDCMQIFSMRESFKAHPYASALTEGSEIEKSMYWTDRETGVLCKSRPDSFRFSDDSKKSIYVTDLKTSANASQKEFERSMYGYGYHIQCAMQREAIKAILGVDDVTFFFAVVEKDAPHCTAVYELDESAVDFGKDEFRRYLKIYKQCADRNEWPGYSLKKVTLPSWAVYEIGMEEAPLVFSTQDAPSAEEKMAEKLKLKVEEAAQEWIQSKLKQGDLLDESRVDA